MTETGHQFFFFFNLKESFSFQKEEGMVGRHGRKELNRKALPNTQVPDTKISSNELLIPSRRMSFLDPDDNFSRNHSNCLEVEQSLNL